MRHGSHLDPPNRFEAVRREPDWDHLEWDQEHGGDVTRRPIEYLEDASQSIVSENTSPDIPFRYSLNPYRGCIHACAYCYARPTHEYLGFNAGLDFETKIVVKRDAPRLFREFLLRDARQPSAKGSAPLRRAPLLTGIDSPSNHPSPSERSPRKAEPITFSGVTDCYQPAEREFRLTRRCLEVAAEFRQPISIVTKNALVARDLDLLRDLASEQLVHVYVSITTLDAALARDMEPRTSIPAARLRAVEMLAEAGIPVGVMAAPLVPGLNDHEVPAILQAAKRAGAGIARYTLLRLPLTVEPVFEEWLRRTRPELADKVLSRIRETRRGKLNQSAFGERMTGSGEIADQIRTMFQLFQRKLGLDGKLPPHNCDAFRPPLPTTGQLRLF